MSYSETSILQELDLAFNETPSGFFPAGNAGDVRYNFFLDLEHGYCVTAGNRIHLYADAERWAIVFEKSGYFNRAFQGKIELTFIGNCISYHVQVTPERNYISNTTDIILIGSEEFERIENREGSDMEQFELISPSATAVTIRNKQVIIEQNASKYESLGIQIRDYDNPKKLIGFDDLLRYLHETNPEVLFAGEEEIKQQLPADLSKVCMIDAFHYSSFYNKNNLPSAQETFQLIARVLVTKDQAHWLPTLPPNNHWKNWESGNL